MTNASPRVTIQHRPAFRVAGTQYVGRNQQGEVPAMWDHEFLPRMHELDAIRVGAEAYGIARATPQFAADGSFEYLAAVQVASFERLPAGMVGWEIPAQTYAVFAVHDVSGLGPGLDWYYHEWLPPSAEWQGADGPMLEVYPPDYGTSLTISLWCPVSAKG